MYLHVSTLLTNNTLTWHKKNSLVSLEYSNRDIRCTKCLICNSYTDHFDRKVISNVWRYWKRLQLISFGLSPITTWVVPTLSQAIHLALQSLYMYTQMPSVGNSSYGLWLGELKNYPPFTHCNQMFDIPMGT